MQTMLAIIGFYLILGMFMETLSMMLTTIPVVFPIVTHMGFDPIWFGIMITVLMASKMKFRWYATNCVPSSTRPIQR